MYQPKWQMTPTLTPQTHQPSATQPAQTAKEPAKVSRFGTWWQKSKLRTWWEKNKKPLIIIAIVVIVLLIAFALAVYQFGWDWTGFNGGYSKVTTTIITPGTTVGTEQQPTKTLWDVLQLLIVPLILAIGVFWLNQIQKQREEDAASLPRQNVGTPS